MNLERLEEALDDWDDRGFWLSTSHWHLIADAARAWLRWGPAVEAAEEADWCLSHDLQAVDGECEAWVTSTVLNPCRVEPVLVVRRRLLAEEPENERQE